MFPLSTRMSHSGFLFTDMVRSLGSTLPPKRCPRRLGDHPKVNGIVFEVQIVHTKMLGARTGMDAHKAYNQFRSFFEIFDMLDIDTKLDEVVVGEGGGSGGDGSGGDGAAHDEELAMVRAENAALKASLSSSEIPTSYAEANNACLSNSISSKANSSS